MYTYKGFTFDYENDFDGDVTKMYQHITFPDGKRWFVDFWSPYRFVTNEEFVAVVDEKLLQNKYTIKGYILTINKS